MASTMKSKADKWRRQRRLAPRRFSADYIPVGMPPNQLVMREYKERTRSLAFDATYIAELEMKQRFNNVPPGRYDAEVTLKHMKRIQEGCPSLMCVTIFHSPFLKGMLFYNSERTRFAVLEYDLRKNIARSSMFYSDRARCITAYKSDTIRWVEFSSVHPPTPKPEPEAPPRPPLWPSLKKPSV